MDASPRYLVLVILGMLFQPGTSASLELGEDAEMEISGEPFALDAAYLLEPEEEVIEARIDWGDGETTTATLVEDGQRLHASKVFIQEGEFVVSVALETSTGITTDSLVLRAVNQAPVVDALGDKVLPTNRVLTLEGLPYYDAGLVDGHSAEIDWGDGVVESIELDQDRQELFASHAYASDGPFSVQLNVADQKASGSDRFTVHPPLGVEALEWLSPTELALDWRGGAPPYRVLGSDNLEPASFEPLFQTDELGASLNLDSGHRFFLVESEPAAPPILVEFEIEVEREPAAPDSQVTAVLRLFDEPTEMPVDVEQIQAAVGIGQGHLIELQTERIETGVYVVQFTTPFAGFADLMVELPETGILAAREFHLPPGEIVDLQVLSSPFVFPDGVTPFTVSVAAVDAIGNPAGIGYSQFVVESELPYTFEYSDCGEGEFHFTSDQPGKFIAVITELKSGLSTEAELLFPIVGPRNFLDSPIIAEIEEHPLLTVPVELFLAPGWEFEEAVIDVFFDDAMGAIAGLANVVDGDPEDGVTVLGFEAFEVEGGMIASVQLTGAPPFQADTATLHVVFDTALGTGDPPPEGGLVSIAALRSETVHPLFGSTEVPINEDTTTVLVSTCTMKKMKVGHTLYVRTSLKRGQQARTDAEICEAHNKANDALYQACIYFKKTIVPGRLAGREFERNVFTRLGDDKKALRAIEAKIDRVMNKVFQELAKKKIARRVKVCDPNKFVDCVVVTLFNHSIQGGKAVSKEANGGVVIESQKGRVPALTNGRSLAHELVHVLGHTEAGTGGAKGGHATGKDNLMTPTDKRGKGTDLSNDQIDLIRKSKYLADCMVGFYQGQEQARVGPL